MPQIIKVGGGLFSSGELIRINPSNNTIEVSTNEGRSWSPRCTNASYGTFRDLLPVGREILASTSRGLFVSTNAARSFSPRCTNTSSYGDFINLQDEGKYPARQHQQGPVLLHERRKELGEEINLQR